MESYIFINILIITGPRFNKVILDTSEKNALDQIIYNLNSVRRYSAIQLKQYVDFLSHCVLNSKNFCDQTHCYEKKLEKSRSFFWVVQCFLMQKTLNQATFFFSVKRLITSNQDTFPSLCPSPYCKTELSLFAICLGSNHFLIIRNNLGKAFVSSADKYLFPL